MRCNDLEVVRLAMNWGTEVHAEGAHAEFLTQERACRVYETNL